MMERLLVDVIWSETAKAFIAYYEGTTDPVTKYRDLTYGIDSKDTMKDDATESAKTLKNGEPDKNAKCKAWITID